MKAAYMLDYLKQVIIWCFVEVIFSFLIKMSMPDAIRIETAFLLSWGPKDYNMFFSYSLKYIFHNFQDKLIPTFISQLKYF